VIEAKKVTSFMRHNGRQIDYHLVVVEGEHRIDRQEFDINVVDLCVVLVEADRRHG
jgi:hypothetical protein